MDNTELDLLKDRADRMGIAYHPSIGVSKLKEKLAEKIDILEPIKISKGETLPQRNTRLRREANRLTRIRITCMNPAKKDWPGEIISVSNSAIGSIKKFIPFNADDGWHIPQVLLGILQDRQYQSFYTVTIKGKKIKRSKLVKEFAIEMLPNLTPEEFKDLAVKQSVNSTVEQ